jgi:hypothetical protein
MPWLRNDPDPLEAKRRQLEEQQRLLAERQAQLTRELEHSGEEVPEAIKPAEPPVWRMEDDALRPRSVDAPNTRKRNLARQRQRDMILFFICIVAFLFVLAIFLWLRAHYASLNNSA